MASAPLVDSEVARATPALEEGTGPVQVGNGFLHPPFRPNQVTPKYPELIPRCPRARAVLSAYGRE